MAEFFAVLFLLSFAINVVVVGVTAFVLIHNTRIVKALLLSQAEKLAAKVKAEF